MIGKVILFDEVMKETTMLKVTDNNLYGIKKSIIFYFYENPDNEQIKDLILKFKEMCEPEFLYYRYMNADFRVIKNKSKWDDLLVKKLLMSNYRDTVTFSMTDSTKDSLQKSLISFCLREINNRLSYMPNQIYFECEKNISWEKIYSFIQKANQIGKYYYISAGFNIATNNQLYPQSVAKGVKEVQRYRVFGEFKTILDNGNFKAKLREGIEGPNIIQMLNEDIYQKIGLESFRKAAQEGILDYKLEKEGILISIINNDLDVENNEIDIELVDFRMKKLYEFLKPIILKIKKPTMFWKADEWERWMNRYEE